MKDCKQILLIILENQFCKLQLIRLTNRIKIVYKKLEFIGKNEDMIKK